MAFLPASLLNRTLGLLLLGLATGCAQVPSTTTGAVVPVGSAGLAEQAEGDPEPFDQPPLDYGEWSSEEPGIEEPGIEEPGIEEPGSEESDSGDSDDGESDSGESDDGESDSDESDSDASDSDESVPDGDAPVSPSLRECDEGARFADVTIAPAAGWRPPVFTLRIVELGREGAAAAKIPSGRVIVEGETVHVVRPNLVEELTTSAEGVRQDFVISAAPNGRGRLQLVLEARGAKLASRGDVISITFPDGRELNDQDLKVTDSTGKVLPAHFERATADRVRIGVDDRGARYPVRIDPAMVTSKH